LLPGSKRLTRKEYYNQAGIDTRMQKRSRRDAKVATETEVLKAASLKTASAATFEASLLARMVVVEALWTHKLGRWTSMADMSGYAGEGCAPQGYGRRSYALRLEGRGG
jgi:hypothetical protein